MRSRHWRALLHVTLAAFCVLAYNYGYEPGWFYITGAVANVACVPICGEAWLD